MLALAGIGLAIPGLRRSGRGEATNGVAAGLGLALSVLGMLAAIVVGAFSVRLSNEVKDCNDPSPSERQAPRCIQDRLKD
jgi:biopolymer transport protein ExbB/TolQ